MQTRRVNPASLEGLRRVISFEPDDSCKPASEDSGTQGVDVNSFVPSLEYTFVSQHHSVSFYPSRWSQPVQLLLQFRNSTAFLSHLNGLRKSDNQSPSGKSTLVLLPLPEAMPLRCPASHLHRWNPSASSDVCDYFHDKVKVVAIRGTIYRYRFCLTCFIIALNVNNVLFTHLSSRQLEWLYKHREIKLDNTVRKLAEDLS